MKILKFTFLSMFVLAIFFANAQNPGYQGKKFILSVGTSGMPISGAMLGNEKAFDLNLRNSIRLEYVAKSSFSFGVTYEKVNDVIMLRNWSVSNLSPLQELTISQWANTPEEFESAAFFNGSNYGIFTKFYNCEDFGSIAPLGSYLILELYLNDINVYDDGRYFNNQQTQIHKIFTQTLVMGGGIQNIYFNHLTVDLAFNLGINAIGVNAIKKYDTYVGNGGNPVLKGPESKMFSDYIVYARIGIGWLLF